MVVLGLGLAGSVSLDVSFLPFICSLTVQGQRPEL